MAGACTSGDAITPRIQTRPRCCAALKSASGTRSCARRSQNHAALPAWLAQKPCRGATGNGKPYIAATGSPTTTVVESTTPWNVHELVERRLTAVEIGARGPRKFLLRWTDAGGEEQCSSGPTFVDALLELQYDLRVDADRARQD